MPKGVEHIRNPYGRDLGQRVQLSVMPKGVEHSKQALNGDGNAPSATISDAERR